jgi:aryl-alcohol dehydrogenase-like predicted oxidoreductase
MQYRKLGKSGFKVSVIGLGTWPMGGKWWGRSDDRESIDTIRAAIDCGINFIDTAEDYGDGHAELILGRALKGCRGEVIVATKVLEKLRAQQVRQSLEESLERLQTDYVDIFYIHAPNPEVPIEETMGEMIRQKEKGRIQVIGVSNFSARQMEEALKVGRFEVLQPPYNLLWRFPEQGEIPFCVEHEIGVVTYSALAQGLLTGALRKDSTFAEDDERPTTPLFQKENYDSAIEVADELKPIAKRLGLSLPELALAWVIHQEGVTSALVGARSVSEIEQDAAAAEIELSEEDIQEINSISDAFNKRLPRYRSYFKLDIDENHP